MALTHAYFVLLALVALGRLVELGISRRHQRALGQRSARMQKEPGFVWMVLLHVGILLGSGLEVGLLRRPLWPVLALAASLVFVGANALRWWVMRSMATHWNVRVMDSLSLGVVRRGPFRLVRHPNYLAVFLELAALPLIHGAWETALVGTLLHALVLRRRVAFEENILFRHAAYREYFWRKPRFVPQLSDVLALWRDEPLADPALPPSTWFATVRVHDKNGRPS
ncbi:MAG TPA: isoprenylcysteine carboxylmethyltransferase family protein [Polyangiaceae bacterium]|jgi:methyltransferase